MSLEAFASEYLGRSFFFSGAGQLATVDSFNIAGKRRMKVIRTYRPFPDESYRIVRIVHPGTLHDVVDAVRQKGY